MSYVILNFGVLLGVLLLALALHLWTRRSGRQTVSGPAMLLGLVSTLLLTAVFDNVIIGVGLVAYDPDTLINLRIGLAPIEDFAYTVAASVLLPVLWHALSPKVVQE